MNKGFMYKRLRMYYQGNMATTTHPYQTEDAVGMPRTVNQHTKRCVMNILLMPPCAIIRAHNYPSAGRPCKRYVYHVSQTTSPSVSLNYNVVWYLHAAVAVTGYHTLLDPTNLPQPAPTYITNMGVWQL